MQLFDGPSTRVIKRYKSDNRLVVDGTVGQRESRNVYVKQDFQIEQKRVGLANYDDIAHEWVYEEEKDFEIPEGGRVPFQKDHVIDDKLILNKSFKNITFQPYGCSNFLEIDNEAQLRLAPLLCSEKQFDNVCRKPIITYDVSKEIPELVDVNISAYGRIWIGMSNPLPGGEAIVLVLHHI